MVTEKDKVQDDGGGARPNGRPRRSAFYRLWRRTSVRIISLAALVIAVSAITGALGGLWGFVRGWSDDRGDKEACRFLIDTARNYASRDDFQTSLIFLNGETIESKALVERCKNNRDVDILRREVELFKAVADFDQFKYVGNAERKEAVAKISGGLNLLRGMTRNDAEFDALEGLLEDLQDRPDTAVNKYNFAIAKKADYPNVFNYWGRSIFRWRAGGGEWSRLALEKFDRAIALNPGYQWAHANKAAVHLELADDELDKPKPQYDTVVGHLTKAQESFKALDRLTAPPGAGPNAAPGQLHPEPPRIIILRARFHLIQGEARSLSKGQKLEAAEDFTKAKNDLLRALEVKHDLVEGHLLLGLVYEHLARSSNDPAKMQEMALGAFRKAVSLDPNHLEASRKLAYALLAYQGELALDEASTEVMRGLRLLQNYRADLQERRNLSTQDTAKNWFARRLEELEGWQTAFEKTAKGLGRQLEETPPKQVAGQSQAAPTAR